MGYEVFERKVKRAADAAVSLVKQGRLVMNKSAAETFKAVGTDLAFLMWDRENRRIGIRPCHKKDDRRAYKVRFGDGRGSDGAKPASSVGANINAKTFMDYIGVNYVETKQYPARWNDEEQVLEVDLPADAFPHSERQPSLVGLPTERRTA
jgi:hypothetical protein